MAAQKKKIRKQFGVYELNVLDPDQHGSALMLVSWIQIWFCIRNADPGPDLRGKT
jgi:hypothetical protein